MLTRKDLLELANLRDENGHTVSFLFSLHSIPDKSRHTEATLVRDLVREQQQRFNLKTSPGLTKDLEAVLAQTEEVRLNPRNWRIFHACHRLGFSRQFDLPAPKPIRQLQVGGRFLLAPMFWALNLCTPFCVLIFERGQARIFVVQGLHIQESNGGLPKEKIAPRVQASHTGSEKHLERRTELRIHEYFKELAGKLRLFLAEQKLHHVVFGCREDQWGEAKPAFADFEKNGTSMGRFNLSGYEMPSAAVRESAYPVFRLYQRNTTAALLKKITDEPAHGATGVIAVMKHLNEGRVEKLLLGRPVDGTVSECDNCGRVQPPSDRPCIFCGKTGLHDLAADEGLIRQAILADTEILTLEEDDLPGFTGAAALLRY
jgi:peptide subunit release factor 1 (eRF1)